MAALPRTTPDDARDALREAMARLAAGDQAALEVIYRMTRVKLFGICLRILGDRKEAEDALQDVYINLWQRADRYDPARASPISWLATFARNRAIDRLRTGKVRGGAVGLRKPRPYPMKARWPMRCWSMPNRPRRSTSASPGSTRARRPTSAPPFSTARPMPNWRSKRACRSAR